MTDKELKKLNRRELLEIMLDMSREMESMKAELEDTRQKLEDREIRLKKAGSIADAAVELNDLFLTAQRTADEYLENVKKLAQSREDEVNARYEAACRKLEEMENKTE